MDNTLTRIIQQFEKIPNKSNINFAKMEANINILFTVNLGWKNGESLILLKLCMYNAAKTSVVYLFSVKVLYYLQSLKFFINLFKKQDAKCQQQFGDGSSWRQSLETQSMSSMWMTGTQLIGL